MSGHDDTRKFIKRKVYGLWSAFIAPLLSATIYFLIQSLAMMQSYICMIMNTIINVA